MLTYPANLYNSSIPELYGGQWLWVRDHDEPFCDHRCHPVGVAAPRPSIPHKPGRRFQQWHRAPAAHPSAYRLMIPSTSARCRLVLQGLAQFRLRSWSSLNSRTFSMAITAWSAKVLRSAICFSEKGRTSVRRIVITPIGVPSRSNGVARMVRATAFLEESRFRKLHLKFSRDVVDVDCRPVDHSPSCWVAASERRVTGRRAWVHILPRPEACFHRDD